MAIGAFKLWNYSKTPSRGVHEYELEMDGHKIYRGYAKIAPENGGPHDWPSVVLFQKDARNGDSLGELINFDSHKR